MTCDKRLVVVAFDTPLELAKRFIRDCREIVCLGWGPDPLYADEQGGKRIASSTGLGERRGIHQSWQR
jgi:hypothetical protein